MEKSGRVPREVFLIIALEEAKYKLVGMRADIKELGSALRIDELRALAEELDAQTLDPDFWSNQENSSKVLQKVKQTKDTIESYEALSARLEDAITLAEMAIEENEESYIEEVETELREISNEAEKRDALNVTRRSAPNLKPPRTGSTAAYSTSAKPPETTARKWNGRLK